MCIRDRSQKNDKRVYALLRCEEIMCENEAYGINYYGNADDVKALTPKSIFDAWQEMLKKGIIQINVVGNANTDEISNLIKEQFDKIKRDEINRIETKVIKTANEVKKICLLYTSRLKQVIDETSWNCLLYTSRCV